MLVRVSGPGATSQSYAFDAAGNRIAGPLSTSSTYNAADELTSDTGFAYTYDAVRSMLPAQRSLPNTSYRTCPCDHMLK